MTISVSETRNSCGLSPLTWSIVVIFAKYEARQDRSTNPRCSAAGGPHQRHGPGRARGAVTHAVCAPRTATRDFGTHPGLRGHRRPEARGADHPGHRADPAGTAFR